MKLDINDIKNYPPEKVALCQRAEVYLDGVKQDRVTVADEEGGYIVRYAAERAGMDHWPTETLNGKVEIKDPGGVAAP